jgi:DNA-directed RNA polymerase specialized sigma24 family protein
VGQEHRDVLLQRYLNEEDPSAAEACLERLFLEHVEPVVREITRHKLCNQNLGRRHEAQDEEDIRSEAVLQLISRLRDLRNSHAQAPIGNLRGYVAAITYNVYYRYVRTKFPSRWRLKNRIRYLLNHASGFAIWQDEHEEYLCGLTAWVKDRSNENHSSKAPGDLDEFIDSLAPGENVAEMNSAELVKAILNWFDHPILIDELVRIVADLQGIKDLQPATQPREDHEEGSGISVCDLLPDLGVDIVTKMVERSYLERLWMEISQLPQRQRVALLLNLRDAQARDALILFTFTGIANLRQIAQALELPLDEFMTLWNKLPLEDAAIARLLGITRQQVINLRKSARERLVRRMAAT